MQKSKTAQEKISFIVTLAVLVLLVFTKVLLCPLGDLDELWNYNLCRGVSLGYVPYRDFGMVMMPLFTVLLSLPLHISRTLLMYRLSSALLLTASLVLYYHIASRETTRAVGRLLALVPAFLMNIVTYNDIMFMCVMVVYILLAKPLNIKRSVIIGAVCALGILSRQTTGVFLMIAVLLIVIVDTASRKYILQVVAGAASVLAIFGGLLIITGSFADFWDCCLFALIGSSHNSSVGSDIMPFAILIVLGCVADVVLWRKGRGKTDLYHLILGAILLTVAIPIADDLHIISSWCWFVIPIAKLISVYVVKNVKEYIVTLVSSLAAGAILFLNVYGAFGTVTDDHYAEFVGIPMYDGYIDGFAVIDGANHDFEAEGKNVVVLSSRACIFSIMSERFNPPFDLFLTGNLGTKDPLSIVAEVCSQDDVIILMPDNYREENWENPEGVYQYVIDNCTEIARYGSFAWYSPVK